jgi:hypothetical protein
VTDKKPDVIVGGINLSKNHPAEDILDMWKTGRLKEITLKGYVARANGDGTCRFVPWYDAMDAFNEHRGMRKYGIKEEAVQDMKDDIEAKHPIVRRTPQQRVAAMILRIMGDAKRLGGLPGMTPEMIRDIMGEYWKIGDPVTEEMVRRAAAHYLRVAEIDNRESDRHRVTRQYPTA